MLEKKDNYYVKELDNVERYLLRIIKRYFDIEELNNKNTINAIIAEAMTRYKNTIIYERSGVDALNNKAGIVNVDIRSFNGERAFDKKTAFNKDFGEDAETICEGDDPRLSDKREPTLHNHLIKDVNELRETLDSIKKEIANYSKHLHTNLQVLDKIIYSGTKEQIDLIELEQLLSIINPLLQALTIRKMELKTTYNTYEERIRNMIIEFEDVKKYIKYLDSELKKVLEKYTDDKIIEIRPIKEKIKPKADKELFSNIKDIANNNILHAFTQYFNIEDFLAFTESNVSSSNGESMQTMYDGSDVVALSGTTTTYLSGTDKTKRWTYDPNIGSVVCLINDTTYHSMFLSSSKFSKYTHEVTLTSTDSDDDEISIVLATKIDDDTGNVYPITLNVTGRLTSHTNTNHCFSIMYGYGYNTSIAKEIAYDSSFPEIGSWNNQTVRVKIERDRTKFKIYRSEINSNEISATPCIEFNLSGTQYGEDFTEPSSYGYGCFSQQNSKFLDIKFSGVIYDNTISTKPQESVIDYSLMDVTYNGNSVEMQAELLYNNNIVKLPYVTKEFIISTGITSDNKMYVKFQPLIEKAKLPDEIMSGKIKCDFYAQRNLL